ncbi:MAG: immunoglobulin-like domain-containing protein, partial [Sphaerospermopsis kisseleviana]
LKVKTPLRITLAVATLLSCVLTSRATAQSFRITSPSTATASAGSYFFYQVTTSGGFPTSYSMTGQPDSLFFDTMTGMLSGFAPSTQGSFFISITAFDGMNTAFGFLTLTVGAGDTTPPVITLNGSNPMTVIRGSTFTDPGASVTDNVDPPQTIFGTGSVNTAVVGSYTLSYSVTDAAGNSASTTRTVNVVNSTNANLSALLLGNGTLSPTFSSNTTSYTASVSNSVSSTTVRPTAAQTNAVIQVRVNNGTFSNVASGALSSALPLNAGSNPIDVRVTAQDGTTTKTYTFTVTRAASANADLSALSLSSGTLSPAFAGATTNYTATVSNAVSTLSVTPTVSQANATVQVRVNGGTFSSVTSGSASSTLALNTGSNAVDVRVTAQDGTTTKTYTVTVTRAPDTTAPVITLLGENPVRIVTGSSFTDPGATVTDNIDPPRTIMGSGTVNTSVAGEYTLTYAATDSAGNAAAPVTRTILVLTIPQNTATIDFGGSVQTAGDRLNVGFVGSPGLVATAGGGVRVARQGGIGMVYFPAGYGIGADSSTINEAGSVPESSTRTTLSARQLFDDATFGPAGASVTWSPVTNQAITVSPEGVAQASAVYQNTIANFTATIGSASFTNFLTVINTLPDNFGAWAGDTFDDAWEIAQGMTGALNPTNLNNGVPAWQLYAMGINPAVPFTGNPAPARVGTNGGFLTMSYTRNPSATGYIFSPQEAGSLVTGFSNMTAPFSTTNLVNGVEQITTRGSVPMSATNRQFLRLQITRPQP